MKRSRRGDCRRRLPGPIIRVRALEYRLLRVAAVGVAGLERLEQLDRALEIALDQRVVRGLVDLLRRPAGGLVAAAELGQQAAAGERQRGGERERKRAQPASGAKRGNDRETASETSKHPRAAAKPYDYSRRAAAGRRRSGRRPVPHPHDAPPPPPPARRCRRPDMTRSGLPARPRCRRPRRRPCPLRGRRGSNARPRRPGARADAAGGCRGPALRRGAGAGVAGILARAAAGLDRCRPRHRRRRRGGPDAQGPRRRSRRRAPATGPARQCARRAADRAGDRVRGRRADRRRQAGGPRRASGQRQLGRNAAERAAAPRAGAAGVPRAGIVHRLDKETSGLLVVAKTLAAQTSLVRQLQARSMGREYVAARARRRRPRRHRRRAHRPSSDPSHDDGGRARGKPARTHYEWSSASATRRCCAAGSRPGARTRSACTWRRSAIRWSAIPPTDGAGAIAFARQALHAAKLSLVHPVTGAARSWTSPLPADFAALLAALRARGPAGDAAGPG